LPISNRSGFRVVALMRRIAKRSFGSSPNRTDPHLGGAARELERVDQARVSHVVDPHPLERRVLHVQPLPSIVSVMPIGRPASNGIL
jgi:hypothetical protein